MPKTKKSCIDGGSITNFYDVLPDQFRSKIKNPNKYLHGLDLPFRMLVCAPSGSGKTNFVLNLLALFSAGEGTFSEIRILTKNANEKLYDYLKSKSKDIIIKEGLGGSNLPKLDDITVEDREDQKIIIFDDLVLEKNLSGVENYFIRARKFGYSVVFISQSYFRVPKTIRLNVSYLAILRVGSKRDLTMILSEVGIGVTKEQLIAMYDFATSEPMNVFLIHVEKQASQKYYKNFTGLLSPEMFSKEVMGVLP